MPRGGPDYAATGSFGRGTGSNDAYEAAVRQRSIVSYSRTGNVLWMSDFNSGLSEWLQQLAANSGEARILYTPTYQGLAVCRLTGGDLGVNPTGVLKRLAPIDLGRMGLEVTFSVPTPFARLYVSIRHVKDDLAYRGLILIDPANGIIYTGDISSSPPAETQIGTCDLKTDQGDFYHTAKLVVDLATLQYVKLHLDQQVIDLAGVALSGPAADTGKPRIEGLVGVRSRVGQLDYGYVDNVIVTVNEP